MGEWWLLVRSDLVRRRWSVIGLTVLVGLAGAFVVTAATGARRADSALTRFLDATEMWDASIQVDFTATDAVVADVAAQREVAAASATVFIPLVSEELGDEGGVLAGLAPGWLHDVYRPRIIAGRMPDPKRVDELLANEDLAAAQRLAVGDVMILEDYLGLGIAQPMTIVGIHRGAIDLALGGTYPSAIATEAFGRRFGNELYAAVADTPVADQIRPEVVVRMRDDVDDPVQILEGVVERHAPARPRVLGREPIVAPLERSLAVQVEAFWILTVTSGASALLLLGMALARLATGSSHPGETLRAVGVGPANRALAALAAPTLVGLGGSALALVGAVAASPLVPIDSARLVEPDPGIWVDPSALVVGAAVMALGLALVAAALVRLDALHLRRSPRRSGSRLGSSVTTTVGRDLAYGESGWGRLALMANVVGLALVVSVAVYLASVDRLIGSPSLFGSDYDVVLFPSEDVAPEDAFSDVNLDPSSVEAAAITRGAQVTVAGDLLEALVIEPVRGVAGGTILRGRAPQAGDEVALGPTTADRLGLGVGDEVTISGAQRRSMRVVGEAVLAPPGFAAHGDVMWLTPAGAERLALEAQESEMVLDLVEGISDADLAAIVGDRASNPAVVPDAVTNLDRVGQIPLTLVVFGIVLSQAVLAYALFSIVRRRRRDLAILRTFGLPPGRVRGSVLAAGLLIAGPGLTIGVVAGVVLGRSYWPSVAAGVPAVARPAVPLAVVALIVVGALASGWLLTLAPAHSATRVRAEDVLVRE